ncbi:MAG TPA: hypothetical protein VME41_07375 [Stellaceae bacterium]|nr:hypothetical protein [Stellaceae bacterium]
MPQSSNYGALHGTHRQVHEQHTRLEPIARQPRNYEAVRQTQYEADAQPGARPEAPSLPPQPRNYAVLRQAQRQVDDDRLAQQEAPDRPLQRSWTHRGGMVPQQESALTWVRQNHEARMASSENSGAERREQGTQQPAQPGRGENDPDLQEARAAVEEARRREAAERARQHERERGGPER